LVSAAAFFASFLGFLLIGLVPFWGLSLIATTVVFIAPLIYKTNKELIDTQLENFANVANQQTEQVKKRLSETATNATNTTKRAVNDYSAKASDLVGSAKRSVSPTTTTKQPKTEPFGTKKENVPSITSFKTDSVPSTTSTFKTDDFPVAPKQDFYPVAPKEDLYPVAPKEDFTVPPVGQTVNDLRRSEDEPLII